MAGIIDYFAQTYNNEMEPLTKSKVVLPEPDIDEFHPYMERIEAVYKKYSKMHSQKGPNRRES
jgi:hypothetical protein